MSDASLGLQVEGPEGAPAEPAAPAAGVTVGIVVAEEAVEEPERRRRGRGGEEERDRGASRMWWRRPSSDSLYMPESSRAPNGGGAPDGLGRARRAGAWRARPAAQPGCGDRQPMRAPRWRGHPRAEVRGLDDLDVGPLDEDCRGAPPLVRALSSTAAAKNYLTLPPRRTWWDAARARDPADRIAFSGPTGRTPARTAVRDVATRRPSRGGDPGGRARPPELTNSSWEG
jgi:hypothetical protein